MCSVRHIILRREGGGQAGRQTGRQGGGWGWRDRREWGNGGERKCREPDGKHREE